MLQTEHYQLNQWDFEDPILMADFNHDNQTIDAALHGLAGQVAEKADASAVNSLTAQVSQKAEQTALAAEEAARINGDKAEKAAREAAVAALDKRAGAQLIRVETMDQAATSFPVPLNDINWADWREVHFIFQTEDPSVQCSISFNGSSSMYIDSYIGPCWHVIACPCFTPSQPIGGFIHPFNRTYGTFCSKDSFQKVKSLSISTYEGTFQPGTSVTIWGVK
ncbi:hypothetical protein [uncultured Dysosmobacter sp.]|uniref:hypothetical protein n=1 Tax=uncultured Dysosmobacter sp. TaxID=2591384 RepID=UPI002604851A|nr:hypothetical protein [uncultured Dysosmobacter sp.]